MPDAVEAAISPACLLLAAASGFIKTLEVVVVAFPPQFAKKRGTKQSAASKILSIVANLVLTIGEVSTKIMAVGIGPVAVVIPVQISTNLLSNMFLQLPLGIAHYTQNTILGTLVLAASAIMLVEIGPGDIDAEESVLDLVTSPPALTFLGSIFTVVLGSLCAIASKKVTRNILLVFLYAILEQSAVVVCTASTKIAQLDVPNGVRIGMIVLYLCCSIIPTVTGARANAVLDDPSLYIPIGAGTNLLLTALSGLFLWGDGQRITLPLSYSMIYIIVMISVYLVSKDDLLAPTKNDIAEAHMNKVKAIKHKVLRVGKTASLVASLQAEDVKHYADHDLHHLAPRGRLARQGTRLASAERTSELAGPSSEKVASV